MTFPLIWTSIAFHYFICTTQPDLQSNFIHTQQKLESMSGVFGSRDDINPTQTASTGEMFPIREIWTRTAVYQFFLKLRSEQFARVLRVSWQTGMKLEFDTG